MAPKFGTSGLRGLVVELTEDLVSDYVRAFAAACNCNGTLYVGHDLRPSSPQISSFVIAAARAEGLAVVDCGATPTPALALASMKANAGAVMITGSHIPADRNGLKFYVPTGEISKTDEQAITAHLGRAAQQGAVGALSKADASGPFEARYISAFGTGSLSELRIGVYQHSAVARDVMVRILEALGAHVTPLARSDIFIPVDTEALDPETRSLLAGWCEEHSLDAIVSTDGDSDRPMLADRLGHVIPGDVLGVITSLHLGADVICTPVSSNSMVLQMPEFSAVTLTKIGSPFVIDAMEAALAQDAAAKVAGYEANGGFLLGFTAQTEQGSLAPLMTRDSLLPLIAPMVAAKQSGKTLGDLITSLPAVFTAADRLQGIAPEASKPFLERLTAEPAARAEFLDPTDLEASIDTTDGLRITLQSGAVVHLRPSGNAPEFRCYAEASSRDAATTLVTRYLAKLKQRLG